MHFCNIKNRKRILTAVLMAAMAFTAFTGCTPKDVPVQAPESSSSAQSSDTSSAEDTSPAPVKQDLNPFTGLALREGESSTNRPVAVMVNNISASLPQRGIDDADIIYELPVEGAVTRLMAVYSDYSMMPDVGSIRSVRHDYAELIAPYQPIYMHIGGSQAGLDAIDRYKIDDIEGKELAGTAFYQDSSRKGSYASEHTWFANLETLKKGLEKTGHKAALAEPIPSIFKFADAETDVMAENASASPANSVTVKFSSSSTASFDYDAEAGVYKKSQNGKSHIDLNKNAAVTVENILVMYTKVGMLDNIHKEIDLSKGAGYYISNGKKIDVSFSKADVDVNLKVLDLSGNEITMNAGQTWICIAPDTYQQAISIS